MRDGSDFRNQIWATGRRELDMAHALAANARQRDFDAALLADDALVLHALVLAAQALVVLDRAEDARAEQAVTLRLERAVVDGLRLLDLAERPGQNLLRAGERNPDGIEHLRRRLGIEEIHDLLVHAVLLFGAGKPLFVHSGQIAHFVIRSSAAARTAATSNFGRPACGRRIGRRAASLKLAVRRLPYSAASGSRAGSSSSLVFSSSTLRPSERISLTSTLKLSGMPASNVSSPLTIAS